MMKWRRLVPYLLFQILLNKSSDSLSLFCVGSSRKTILKLEHAVTKMIAVTSLKHCIHLRRSSRWPPTSNILKVKKENEIEVYYCKKKLREILTENLLYLLETLFQKFLMSRHDILIYLVQLVCNFVVWQHWHDQESCKKTLKMGEDVNI